MYSKPLISKKLLDEPILVEVFEIYQNLSFKVYFKGFFFKNSLVV